MSIFDLKKKVSKKVQKGSKQFSPSYVIMKKSYPGPFLFLFRSYFVLSRSYLSYPSPIFSACFPIFSGFFWIFLDFLKKMHFVLMQSVDSMEIVLTR
jgi:hypothetical protein